LFARFSIKKRISFEKLQETGTQSRREVQRHLARHFVKLLVTHFAGQLVTSGFFAQNKMTSGNTLSRLTPVKRLEKHL
jgi:hypothetical protein